MFIHKDWFIFLKILPTTSNLDKLSHTLETIQGYLNNNKLWNNKTFTCVTAWKVSVLGVFFGPYFVAFVLNTGRYSVFLRIQSECGKIRTRKTPSTDTLSRNVWKNAFLLHERGSIIIFHKNSNWDISHNGCS